MEDFVPGDPDPPGDEDLAIAAWAAASGDDEATGTDVGSALAGGDEGGGRGRRSLVAVEPP